ncbi:hypothetical protein LEP1GSC035_3610 [Leptospira noguchii str. 2007001578]|uniref:Uncharacterized protein n=2 Tax=Leptospira noguchii TaxID=28182 RepID=M6Y003_9LEPT|nr:hypothetical protein LEP1GSC035_3610 [Leptospira noguchii str. 2007001578]EMO87005.1 hypothetical protein LEP1GSC024_0502 [Leptospira noguchii str. 2001034031]
MSLKNSEGIGAKRTQHNAFLWVALTQRLASIGARQVVSQSTMKFANDSPQFSYVELTLVY